MLGAPRRSTELARKEPTIGSRWGVPCCARRAALALALAGCAGPGSPARELRDASSAPREHDAGEQSAGSGAAAAPAAAPSSRLDCLSPGHVGAAIRAHRGEFQACQALGDLESRREDGAVTVGWVVRPDGSVNEVTVGPSTFESERINACVLDVARQVTFPASSTASSISWTVKFLGAGSAPLATAH